MGEGVLSGVTTRGVRHIDVYSHPGVKSVLPHGCPRCRNKFHWGLCGDGQLLRLISFVTAVALLCSGHIRGAGNLQHALHSSCAGCCQRALRL